MFTVKSREAFLDDIRSLDERLKNIRISSIEVDKRLYTITYNFICDVFVDDGLKKKVHSEAEKITDKIFNVVYVKISKIASNVELINNEIYNYLNSRYTSVSLFLKRSDIYSQNDGEKIKYTLTLTSDGFASFNADGGVAKLNNFLCTKFCSDFFGDVIIKEKENNIDIGEDDVFTSELKRIEHRTIKVKEVVSIDDNTMGDLALYLEDFTSGDAVICGNVVDIKEKTTKTDKPFFLITISDKTATQSGIYFTKKSTYKKIKDIKVDDAIIARATMGEYKGSKSLTFTKINRCVFPSDFVKKERFKNQVPARYNLVKPEVANTLSVRSVFYDDTIPQQLKENTYVVFDLETTGLEPANCGITEIGAVKIIDGKIAEQFTTLVNPEHPISEEITGITGIDFEMVKDKHKIAEVLPDFIKFIDGAILVGHNVDFDCKFIRKYATEENYEFSHKTEDTMLLSRSLLPKLKRNDLHTVADYFNIAFHHHRALSDAYATAECFIELMKLKEKA